MTHFLAGTGNAGVTRQSMLKSLLSSQIRVPRQQGLPFVLEFSQTNAGDGLRRGFRLSREARHVWIMSKTFVRPVRS